MAEFSRSLSVEEWINANNSDSDHPDQGAIEYLDKILNKYRELSDKNVFKKVSFNTVIPYVAFAGDLDKFISYFEDFHSVDPRT